VICEKAAMKQLLIAAAALSLMGAAAHAQDRPQPPNPDANHDGKVTWAEFKATSAERSGRMFARMDLNHDGKITAAEMEAARKAREAAGGMPRGPGGGGGFMMRLDANHDGVITKAEMEAGAKARFDAADTNHDGWLSKGELILMRQRMGGPPQS
jgi:hypothetical protein